MVLYLKAKRQLKKAELIIFLALFGFQLALAQPVVDVPITISDGGGGNKELRFGLDSTATDGIDAGLGEESLPPFPPSGVFEARFVGDDISISQLDQGVYKDYRKGDATFNGTKVHELRYQLGVGNTIRVNWDLPIGVTGKLEDFSGGIEVSQTMSESGSYTVTNPSAINKLKMTINYQLTPPGRPYLRSPSDGIDITDQTPTLVWQDVSGATGFDVEVDNDEDFSSPEIDTSARTNEYTASRDLSGGTYYWHVRAKNSAGPGPWSSRWSFTIITTTVEKLDRNEIPRSFWLSQNFPNPFNPSTEIQFTVPLNRFVMVKIYDIAGREINTLVSEQFDPGHYSVGWLGKDNSGKPVPNGNYIYQLQAGNYSQAGKMILLRY